MHLFVQGVEIGVEFGECPTVAVFPGVALIEGVPLAVRGHFSMCWKFFMRFSEKGVSLEK